jgi:hypothetical protein
MQFKKYLSIAVALVCSGFSHAGFLPQNGAWMIDSELDGKPGRGFTLDTQGNITAITFYGYETYGEPTFYVGAAAFASDRTYAPLITLTRYSGGRFIGSTSPVSAVPSSANSDGSVGKVELKFFSTDNGVSGSIKLPGEPEKRISRFNFGYGKNAEGLKGKWLFSTDAIRQSPTSNVFDNGIATTFNLVNVGAASANGNGVVYSPNGLFGCEHQVAGQNSGKVLCAEVNSAGQILQRFIFGLSVNDGQGKRDLAKDLLNNISNDLYVRRLASTTQNTGFIKQANVVKTASVISSPHPAVVAAIEGNTP